ncbi:MULTISPECIES: hypothetical protein [unclassified Neptuniibacter]|uniref:gp53-like domain-containing protein n=1 Tax=unclassified Neptuniibacter TaxID=2630693 RepID=UPI0025DFE517|nr:MULTISPECIES: hypothetical protein [unclassified Neptuniibacter]|tara:strand:- start:1682 stop:2179 length:498 start_codon:yes stop_codon:yes gene_type:complete
MDYPSEAAARLDPTTGKFTNGDPLSDLPASRDSADYQNMVFDSLINLIEGAALTPDEGDLTLVLQAVQALGVSEAEFANSLLEDGYQQLPGGLILQWGTIQTTTNEVNYPYNMTYPTESLCIMITSSGSVVGDAEIQQAQLNTTSTFKAANNTASRNARWFSIGH